MRWLNILHAYQPPDWDPKVIDRVTKECYRPLSAFLLDNPKVRLTLNFAGVLVEQLASRGHHDVIDNLRRTVERGQIELMMMPKYHPIIPFLTPEEAEHQVEHNRETMRLHFGASYQPTGFFPPELAVSDATGFLVARLGFQWILMDEVAFGHGFQEVDLSRLYRWRETHLRCLFRNRNVSDYLAFSLSETPANGFSGLVRSLGAHGDTVLTAMDAENLGHHRPAAAPAWQALVLGDDVETMTVADYLAIEAPEVDINPLPSSWSTDDHDLRRGTPYPLWDNPENPVHQGLHTLLRLVQTTLATNRERQGYSEARERLDKAEASDVFWWASMRPWWDAPIVLREAEELYHALDPLKLELPAIRDAWRNVRATITEWESHGLAKAARETYIENHRPNMFFAGHHIK